jgi:predicted RNA-binding protein with PIN domain
MPVTVGSSNEVLPLPESLLAPLLDAAASTIPGYDDDLPGVLRPLAGFDPRRLRSGAARQQLHRALDVDSAFRERVAARFLERSEASGVLERWSVDGAPRHVEDAASQSDLPLLASVLYAARPEGWAFGIGLAYLAFDRQRIEKERDDDARAREMQHASTDEARRRAETARDVAQASVERLEAQLRDERRARRDREMRADRAVEDAARRRQEAETKIAAAEADVAGIKERLAREGERARQAEQRLREVRREQQAVADRPVEHGLDPDDVRSIAEAAREAQQLASRLEALTTKPRTGAPPRPSPRSSARTPSPRTPSPRTPNPRTRVPCPPGLAADTPAALDTMLRTRGVRLVVDGYNVSMAGWHDDQVATQRERLLGALERLHLRLRADVTVVFDGADVEGVRPPRRTGVRTVFSTDGEKADPVVVREVERLPGATPAIVASSDGWVREHAEAAGATVVSAASLLEILRR